MARKHPALSDKYELEQYAAVQVAKKSKTDAKRINVAWTNRGGKSQLTPAEFRSLKAKGDEYMRNPRSGLFMFMNTSRFRRAVAARMATKTEDRAFSLKELSADVLNEIREDLDESTDRYDNLGERAQEGEKGERLQENIDAYESIIYALEGCPKELATLRIASKPRAKLLDQLRGIVEALSSVTVGLSACQLLLPKQKDVIEELQDRIEDMNQDISDALSVLDR